MEEAKRRKSIYDKPGYIAVSRKAVPVDDLILPLTENDYIIFEFSAEEVVALGYSELTFELKKETGVFVDIDELEQDVAAAEVVPAIKRIAERLLSESGDEVERSALEKVLKASEEAERLGTPMLFWF